MSLPRCPADEISALVFEFGSWTSKIGCSGEDLPRAVFPTYVGHPSRERGPIDSAEVFCEDNYMRKRSRDLRIGETEIYPWQEDVDLRNPMKDCLVDVWDDFEALIEYSYWRLNVSPEEHPLMLCEPAWNSYELKAKSMEMLFEKFSVPAMYAASAPLLTAFSLGRTSALVLDSGHTNTSVTPVIDGFILRNEIKKQPYAGAYISRKVKELLSKNNINVVPQYLVQSKKSVDAGCAPKAKLRPQANIKPSFHELAVEREISIFKETLLQVSGTTLSENHQLKFSTPKKNYEFPDGYNNLFSYERFIIPEVLFDSSESLSSSGYISRNRKTSLSSPSKDAPHENSHADHTHLDEKLHAEENIIPIKTLVQNCVNGCDPDIIPRLYQNIILSGSNTLMTGFADRVNYELRNALPGMKIRIHAPKLNVERMFAPWIGGSILSSLGTFHQLWISKADYEENGLSIERKFI